jgi:hypothetical protein
MTAPRGVYRLLDGIINPGEPLLRHMWQRGRDGLPFRDMDDRRRGVDVHRLSEVLAAGGRIDHGALPAQDRNAAANLDAWWAANEPQPIGTEVKLKSERLGISGIIDLAFRCRGCPACRHRPDPGVWLADWKIVKRHTRPRARWHFQVGTCYRRLWDEPGLVSLDEQLFAPEQRPPSCGALIVILPPEDDRGPRTVEALGRPEDLEAAVAWGAALDRVEQAIGEDR